MNIQYVFILYLTLHSNAPACPNLSYNNISIAKLYKLASTNSIFLSMKMSGVLIFLLIL
uniref:Uncharacterized protein n=1 Tax=Octopus bimaculoides TaxID=37653 RepID=A0A0L8HSV7_OCTBM